MNYMIEAQNEKHGDKSENIQTLYTPVKNANSRKSNSLKNTTDEIIENAMKMTIKRRNRNTTTANTEYSNESSYDIYLN